MKTTFRQLVFYALLLAVWIVVAKLRIWPPYMVPAPQGVFESLRAGFEDHSFWIAIAVSMKRIAIGYAISVVIGIVLGLLLASSDFLEQTLGGLMVSLQSLPSICWLPLAVLWFGLTEKAILFVVVMGSLLAISISTEDGVNSIQPQLILAAGTLGIRGLRFYGGVLVPAALPGIVTGLKLGWSFAWRALMAGELLFVSGGLGQLLTAGRELLDVAQVVAVMIAIIVLGTLMDRLLFQTVEMRVRRRWGLLPAS